MSGKLNVLIVEDNPNDLELLLYELRRSDFETEWTSAIDEPGYIAALDQSPDLIVADYTLPQFSAIQALRLLQDRGMDVPFIVVTGTVSEEIAVDCMKLGAADYLLKDRLTRLGQAARHALEQKHLRDQKRQSDEALRLYMHELERLVSDRTVELRAAKEHVEAILNNASDAIVLFGFDGAIQQTNPAFSRLFGSGDSSRFGQSVLQLAAPNSRDVLAKVVSQVAETGHSKRLELAMIRADGTVFDADVAFDVVTETSNAQALVGSFRDITRRKQMERALQESEARYRRLAENAQDTIFRYSLHPVPRFEYISPAIMAMTGYTPQEHYADPDLLRQMVYPEDLWLLQSMVSKPEQTREPLIIRWRRRDGSIIWTEQRNVPVYDEDGHVVAVEGIARDITRRQQADEELRKALEKERELNELKSRFVSMVSHEFRTPLAVIQSAGDLLKMYSERMTPQRRVEQLHEIHLQVRRLTNLLDDILAISRVERLGVQLRPKPVDLRLFCSDIARESQFTSNTHTIKFAFKGETGEVVLDTKLMRQALGNLLSNAIKYSPVGTTVYFDVETTDQDVQIRIRDEGIGIPAEDQKHLFEVFHRGANVGQISGTGLGLAIVKQAVDAHGGTIEVESAVGEGTTFILTVPSSTVRVR